MADQKNPLVLHPLVPKELLPAPRWLIRGVIPLGHSPSEIFITVLFGPGGTFKTYTFISWAVCMALARDWFGHKVRPGINVLYIAADDPGGPQPRGQAWAGFFELTLEDLDQLGERARLIKGAINFFETEEVDWAIEELKRIGFKPTVVFIDTYFHSSQGADISTSVKDNLQVIGNIRRFAEEVGAEAIVVSDHSPKDGRSLFGSVIKGVTIDVLWEAQTTEGSETSGTITNTRMRNAPMSPPLALEFEQVDHETLPDEDGQSIFPQLVLADARVSQAKPEAKSLSEKERKQKLDAMIVAACYVIGENWEIGQKIPSRRDFRKMAEAKFKA